MNIINSLLDEKARFSEMYIPPLSKSHRKIYTKSIDMKDEASFKYLQKLFLITINFVRSLHYQLCIKSRVEI